MQLGKGNNLVPRRMIPFPDDGRFIRMFFQVPIQTVGTDIELTIGKPFDFKIVFVKAGIFDLGKGLDPVQTLRLFCPKFIWLFYRILITFKVLVFERTCCFFKFFGYWIDLLHRSLP